MNFEKSVVFAGAFLLLILFSFNYISAITGSIGNARMVLRVDQGDKIEKSILVKNVNDVSVNVELTSSGDLAEYIYIKDKQFALQPGDEKKAFFTIYAKKSGTSESKINIKFSPEDGGTGVGLSSTIIVIAKESGGFFDWFNNKEESDSSIVEEESQVSFGSFNKKTLNENQGNSSKNINNLFALGLFTIILFAILLILLAVIKKRKTEKSQYKTVKQKK